MAALKACTRLHNSNATKLGVGRLHFITRTFLSSSLRFNKDQGSVKDEEKSELEQVLTEKEQQISEKDKLLADMKVSRMVRTG